MFSGKTAAFICNHRLKEKGDLFPWYRYPVLVMILYMSGLDMMSAISNKKSVTTIMANNLRMRRSLLELSGVVESVTKMMTGC